MGMVNTRIASASSVDVEGISHDQKGCIGTSFRTYPDLSLADCATKAQQWNNQNQQRANFATFETCPNSKGGEDKTKCTLMSCKSIIDHDTSTILNLQSGVNEYDFRA